MSPRKPGRWPDKARLLELIELGWSNSDIADAINQAFGWKPSPSGVSRHLKSIGVARRRMSHKDLIWWTIRPQHQHDPVYYWLVALDKERKGAAMSVQEKYQAQLLKNLLLNKAVPLVVDYQPDVYPEHGFCFVPARTGDDVVRRPRNESET